MNFLLEIGEALVRQVVDSASVDQLNPHDLPFPAGFGEMRHLGLFCHAQLMERIHHLAISCIRIFAYRGQT